MARNPPAPPVDRPLFEELERRLLLSADVPVADPGLADPGAAEPAPQVQLLESEDADTALSAVARRELVFVDTGVQGYEALVEDLHRDASLGLEVILLDAERDGIAQISEALSDREDLSGIHILSHGSIGTVSLGSSTLTQESLSAREAEIAGWGDAVALDGDILFYGCDLAGNAAGVGLLESLAKLTGADVAASTDTTGHAELGGNWVLEYQNGVVESAASVSRDFQASWYSTLAIESDALWLSTKDDVVTSGAPGLGSWTQGEVLEFGDPNLAFEPTGTDGTFSSVLDLDAVFDDGDVNIAALHFVTTNITVGGGGFTFDLFSGDVLFALETIETIGASSYDDSSVHVFRPDTPGDYSSGTVTVLLDLLADFDVRAITLVEQSVTVGDVTLNAGEFLYSDNNYAAEIRHFAPTGVGLGNTTGTKQTFLDSSGPFNLTQDIGGLDVIEVETTIGGETLLAGTILATVAEPDSVANNNLSVDDSDIFQLTVSQTIMGSATSDAVATLFMDGSLVMLDSGAEDVIAFSLQGTNNAPVLTPAAPTFTSITEDDTGNTGELVSTLLGASVSDADSGAVEGVAVTSLSSGGGTWQYKVGAGAWTAVGAVAGNNALLLAATDSLRFVPDGQNAESPDPNLTYHAWDQTSGTAGTKVDATTNGGATAFSTATDTASISVTSLNDAPTLTPSTPSLTTITEDETSNGGDLVSALLGASVADVDNGAVEGIAITSLSGANGTWQYDTGSGWTNVGPVSATSALLLRATDSVRFLPDGQNGGTPTFTFRAWDQATGAAGTKVDPGVGGGSSAFSTSSDTASITVTETEALWFIDAADTVIQSAGNPGLSFEPAGGTAGTLSTAFDLASFAGGAEVWSMHYVTANLTVGSAVTFDLEAGDLLLSSGSGTTVNGTTTSVAVTKDDVFVFRPDAPGNYAAGEFFMLLDGLGGGNEVQGFTLVEKGVTVGGTPLPTGSFIFSKNDGADARRILWVDPSEVGNTPMVGAPAVLVDGHAGDVGFGDRVSGIDVIEEAITLGGTPLSVGQLLVTLQGDDGSVGKAPSITTTEDDIFVLDVVSSTEATATLLFEAADLGVASVFGLTLFTDSVGANQAPVLDPAGSMTLTGVSEDAGAPAGQTVDSIIASAGGDRITDGDPGAVEGIAITSLSELNGTWQADTGSGWTNVGPVTATSALLLRGTDSVRFLPDGANGGSSSFDFRAWDQTTGTAGTKVDPGAGGGTTAFSLASESAGITVTSVNDAPVLTAATPSFTGISEDDTANGGSLVSTLLGASVADVDAGAVEGLAITSLVSGNGTWEYRIGAGAWTAVGAVASNNALLLASTDSIRFVPDGQNAESPDPSFSYHAWDQSSGAAGSKVDASTTGGTTAYSTATDTASITVTAVNDAPVLTAATPSLTAITENDTTNGGNLVSTLLGASVADVDNGAVEGLAITSLLSGNGTWEYRIGAGAWTAVGAVASNNALLLASTDSIRFVPDGQNAESPDPSFSYHAWDQSSGAAGTKVDASTTGATTAFSTATDTASVSVTAVNDAPVLTAATPSLTAINEDDTANGGSLVSTLLGASVADVDNGAVEGIAITSLVSGNGTWEYRIGAGAWTAVGAVASNNALLLAATDSVRFVPDGQNAESPDPSFTYHAWDQSSGAAGSKVDASTTGGTTAFSTATDTASISVTAMNDAPVLTAATPSLTAINEDDTANGGSLVSTLLGASVADVDAGAVEGIAITSLVSGNGTWEYRIGAGAWTAVGAVASNNALLLASTDSVRFVPDGQNAESPDPSFTYHAWDRTSGAASSKVDASTTGGTTAFSTATDTASISVTAVNDAPALDAAGSMTLTNVNQDDANPAGDTVASIVASAGGDRITDMDLGAVEGLAVIGVDDTNGTWQYSTNGGGSWNAFGAVTPTSAVLLDAAARIRFVPDAAYVGPAGDITFRAWDQSSGSNGQTGVDVSTNGGTTAYSTLTETATLTVLDVNDAPVLTPATPSLTAISEDDTGNGGELVSTIVGASISDVDAGAVEGIAVTSLVSGNGTWEYRIGAGAWTAVGAVASNNALLLASTDSIRFVPDGQNAESPDPSFSYHAWDQSSGAAGTKVDASTTGGTTAFSTATDTASISVTAVNDAPVLTAATPSLTAITENDTANSGNLVSTLLGASVADVDAGAVEGIAITSLVSGNGTWEYRIGAGAWTAVGAVANNNALLLSSTDSVRFVPDGQNAESPDPSFTYHAWDKTSGAAGSKVDASTTGGTTSFSTATDTASISVSAVNDAPVLDAAGSMTLTNVNQDDTNPAGDTVAAIVASAGGDRITDVDLGAVEGLAVIGVDDTNGTWQYSTNGGGSWNAFGAVTPTSAVLLDAAARIRFVPDAAYVGPAGDITFRAWDQSSGSNGQTGVDVSTNGGTTAYSTLTETATLTVLDVNDAPVLTPATPSLTAISEDDTGNGGELVSTLVGASISDVDAGAVEGIAITSLSSGNGTWEYRIGAGAWTAVGAVAGNNALLLASTDSVRFVPDGQNAESPDPSFTYHAWDQSSGAAGSKVDASTTGGTTAFSTATDTASISVTAVNDAPVLTAATPSLTAITENDTTNGGNLVSTLLGASVADVDNGAVEGIAVTSLASGNGTWQYRIGAGAWTAMGAVASNNALLLASTDSVRFVPDGQNAESPDPSFSFHAWDQTSGAAGSMVDATTTGGTTAFSTATDTASISVTAVNDAPVVTAATPSLTAITEDDTANSGSLVSTLLGASVADVDNGAVEGIAITSLVSGNGTWEYRIGAGAWTAVGAVASNNALLLASTDSVRFVPDGQNAESPDPSFSYHAWDQTSGAAGSKVDATTTGGTTAFSTATDTASISVTAVNDAPVLAAALPSLTAITEDDTTNGGNLVSALLGASVADVDNGAVEGLAITSLASGNGTWQYRIGAGAWTAVGSVAANNALLLADMDSIRFVPDGQNGETPDPSISYHAWDRTSGAAGSKADASTTGGTTAFSTATDTASIAVSAVNDAPQQIVPGSQTTAQDTSITFSGANGNGISVADVDAGAGNLEVTLTASSGSVSLGGVAGLTFLTGDGSDDTTMTFRGTLGAVNAALDGTRFVPTTGFSGAAGLTLSTSDLGNSGAGGALSTSGTVVVTVEAELTPPVLDPPGEEPAPDDEEDSTHPAPPEVETPGDEPTPETPAQAPRQSPSAMVPPLPSLQGERDGTVPVALEEAERTQSEGQSRAAVRSNRAVAEATDSAAIAEATTQRLQWEAFDQFRQQLAEDAGTRQDEHGVVVATAEGMALAASAGVLAWLARSGSLFALGISALPMWRRVDPLPVLSLSREERERFVDELRAAQEEEERLDRVFEGDADADESPDRDAE